MDTPLKYTIENAAHYPVTMLAVYGTNGRILELGTGQFSTPLLHFACYPKKRELVSFEDNHDYYRAAQQFESDFHTVTKVENWDDIPIQRHWDVALVDHTRSRRVDDIKRLAWWANYIIVPDTTQELEDQLASAFAHQVHFHPLRGTPTLMVSNLIDISRVTF